MESPKKPRVATFLVAASALFLLSSTAAFAATVYSCVNKTTGALRVVTATTVCDSRKETPLSWSTTGPLQVVDANGQVVGFLGGVNQVNRLLGSEWFSITGVTSTGFYDGGGFELFYASTDCSGPAFHSSNASLPLAVRYAGSLTSITLYYKVGPVLPSFTTFSYDPLRSDGVSGGCVAQEVVLSDARQLSSESLTVVLPLRVTQ